MAQSNSYDVTAARAAGKTDDQILNDLTAATPFNVQGALAAKHSKSEIIDYLSSRAPAPAAPPTAAPVAPVVPPSRPWATPGNVPRALPLAVQSQQTLGQPDPAIFHVASDAIKRAITNHDVRELLPGAEQAKVHGTALLNAVGGFRAGGLPGAVGMGVLSELNQDKNYGGAAGSIVAGELASPLLRKAFMPDEKTINSIVTQLPQGWKAAAAQSLLHGVSTMAGYAGGTAATPGQPGVDIPSMALMSLLTLLHAGGEARKAAVANTPGYVSEKLLGATAATQGRASGDLVGGKNTPAAFSDLSAPAPAGLPGPGGAATAAIPMGDPMQAALDKLRALAGRAASNVAVPTRPSAALATLASDLTPKPQKNVQPADAAAAPPPQPPKKDDKLESDEAARQAGPAMAGAGGTGSPVGPGALPPELPGAGHVALDGTGMVVRVPDSEVRYPSQFKVRELEDLIASHDPHSFNHDPRYPFQNERDYSIQGPNQDHVVLNSEPGKLEPGDLINTNNQATSGPPVVTPAGVVMGGNGRTLILKRAMRNAADAARYRDYLKANAHQFGIDPAQLDKFRSPVLVRELAMEPDAIHSGAPNIIADLNVDPQKAKSAEEQAIADGRRLQPHHWDVLNRIIEDAPEDKTIRAVLDDPQHGRAILENLMERGHANAQGDFVVTRPGVFRQAEMGKIVEGGELTSAAKDRIEAMLVGRYFDDPRQMANTPAAVKDKLARSAGTMARLANYPGWDIGHMMPDAIRALQEGRVHGFSDLNLMNKQPDFSGNVSSFDDPTLAVANMLKTKGSKAFNGQLKGYLNDAEIAAGRGTPSLFEAPRTLEESFGRTFGVKGLKPSPVPERAAPPPPPPPPAPAAPAAPPPEAPPSAPPPPKPAARPVVSFEDLANHAGFANQLDEILAKGRAGRKSYQDLVTGLNTRLDQPSRDAVGASMDAARAIPQEDFQALYEHAHDLDYARNHGHSQPAPPASYAAARDRLAASASLTPEHADIYAAALARLHARMTSGLPLHKLKPADAHVQPLTRTLDTIKAGLEGTPPPPTSAPTPDPVPAQPLPQGYTSLPGATSTSAYDPRVQAFEALRRQQAAAAAAERAAVAPVPPRTPLAPTPDTPARPGPPPTYGTASYDPRVQMAEEREQEAARAQARQREGGTATATLKNSPPDAGPTGAATWGFLPKMLTAEQATAQAKAQAAQAAAQAKTAAAAQAAQAKVQAKAQAAQTATQARAQATATRAAAAAARMPTEQQMLDDVLTKAYDRTTRTFPNNLANTLGNLEAAHHGILDRVTNGNGRGLLQYADDLTKVWDQWGKMVDPSGQPKGLIRAWFDIPIISHMRGGHDIPHPFNRLAAQTQLPSSDAARTMHYLATNPSTPAPYVQIMLRALMAKGDAAAQAKQR